MLASLIASFGDFDSGRGRAPGRRGGGARALAARRRAAAPGGVAHGRGAAPRPRPAATPGDARGQGGGAAHERGAAPRRARRRGGGRHRARRTAAPALHVLPSRALARGARRAHAAHARRALDGGRRARASCCPSRRSPSASSARSARSATPASRTGCRPRAEWAARLASVLAVLYLIFNEGYSATDADPAARRSLCEEAIRLGARAGRRCSPREGEVHGAPRADAAPRRTARCARSDADGALVPARRAGSRALAPRRAPLQGLAACAPPRVPRPRPVPGAGRRSRPPTSSRASGADTPWPTIAALYAELESLAPSPVVRVNRAVAEGRARGPEAGLALLAAPRRRGRRAPARRYQPYHAARADLLRRAGRSAEAAAAYRTALELCRGEPERRFLADRLASLERGTHSRS